MKIQLKRSNVTEANGVAKEPTALQMEYGELAVNYNTDDPAIFIKANDNTIIRIAGVGNIADDGQVEVPSSIAPPSAPLAGNLWFNPLDGRLYVYYDDGNSTQWVDASPDSWNPSVIPDPNGGDNQPGTLDDRYVQKVGDNMTGHLTLGDGTDDKISLWATTGGAQFDSNVLIGDGTVQGATDVSGLNLGSGGTLTAIKADGSTGEYFRGYTGTIKKANINAAGSLRLGTDLSAQSTTLIKLDGAVGTGEFAGDITVGGKPITSAGVQAGSIIQDSGSNIICANESSGILWKGRITGDSTETSIINADGSSKFVGDMQVGGDPLDSAGVQSGVALLAGSTKSVFATSASGTAIAIKTSGQTGSTAYIKGDGSCEFNNIKSGYLYLNENGDLGDTSDVIRVKNQAGNETFAIQAGGIAEFQASATFRDVVNVRGALDLSDNVEARFGSGDDVRIDHDGANFYIRLNSDDDLIITDENNDLFALRVDSSERRLYVYGDIYAGYNASQFQSGVGNAISTYAYDAANQTSDTWTAVTQIAADWRGKANETTNESTHHFIAQVKDRAGNRSVMSKIDVSGNYWGQGSYYAGRAVSSTTGTPISYYGRSNEGYGFVGYNGIPFATGKLYSSSYRAYVHMRPVFDDADDRKTIYGVKSDTDGVMDYDADQYLACSAMGRFDVKGQIRSGRVESDETTPNSIYAPDSWGGSHGIAAYRGNSNSYTVIYGQNTASAGSAVFRVRVNQTSDKMRFDSLGEAYTDGSWNTGSADYAEYFEWEDGNLTDEDRRALPVVLNEDGKIRVATAEDDTENIIGVISAHPAFVGDSAELSWHGLYLKDDYGMPVTEDELWLIWKKEYKDGVPINQPKANDPNTWADTDGFPLSQLAGIEAKIAEGRDLGIPRWAIQQNCIVNKPKQITAPDYDASQVYIPRSKRKEWDTVGLIGKLAVVKGSPVGARWIKMHNINDKLDRYFVR